MYIKKLHLKNYRNHTDLILNFDEKTNLIFGVNGSGKTNILEALHLLSVGHPFKAKYDKEIIKFNKDFARIEALVATNGDNNTLTMLITSNDQFENASSKKVTINKVPKTLKNFYGNMPTVLFCPEDLEIITHSPTLRRRYMDTILSQTDKEYKRSESNYQKAMKQRNKLLDHINEFGKGYDQLPYWDEQIITNGQFIQSKRNDLLQYLEETLPDISRKINDDKMKLTIKYKKSLISKERLKEYLDRDIATRSTLIGPHKDDFVVYDNMHDLSIYGSRGQQRAAILALKLLELDYIAQINGERPVLLLDDIFSEFDQEHRDTIKDVTTKQQTIVTTAEDLRFFERANVISL